ncbi:MAG: AAA family ATPase [bacterium]|nr:AAA family ATPase [bacterium]
MSDPRQLNKIVIKGFKSIREAEIELRDLNVFIGANGAGKSNFVSLFKLLREIIEGRLQVYTGARGADYFLYGGRKTTDAIRGEFYFGHAHHENNYQIELIPSIDDSLIFADEEAGYRRVDKYDRPKNYLLGEGHKEAKIFEVIEEWDIPIVDYVAKTIQEWRVYHFHDTSETAKLKQPVDIDDNRQFREDGSNLAAFLYRLQQMSPDSYQKIVRTVQQVAPFFGDFQLQPSALNPEKIRLEWRDNETDSYFNAHYLSDGTLRFICLVTLLLQPNLPPLIIIDEPELGLHPFAITLLASLLRKASIDSQVIIATQSVTLVNQFEAEDVIVVERQDKQSVFKRLDTASLEGWLEDYGIGDLWEKNVIGGRPKGKATQ